MVKAGDILADRYRIESVAGTGGMGSVFRSVDLMTDQPCAIKVIGDLQTHGGRRTSVETAKRFVRESRALREIRHPAVVRYVADGTTATGQPFLVMEWAGGQTLRERIQGQGATPVETLALLERLVDALAVIHAVGIVHRDIKPRNLMLAKGELASVRIVDFGIARFAELLSGMTAGLTVTGLRLGTPGYMAPEQILQTRNVDGRADVYSLGCIAYEMLTGHRAFVGKDGIALLARMVLEDAPRVRKLRPDLPPDVDELVARLLVRDPVRRPVAGPELLAEITSLRGRLEALALPAAPALRDPDASQPSEERQTEDDPPATASASSAVVTPGERTLAQSRPPLIGRDEAMAELTAALKPGRIVGLWGAVGVGKSRLLTELGARHAGKTPLLYVDARAARDVASVLREVAMGLHVSRVDAAHGEILRALRARAPLLLLIDGIDAVANELGPMLTRWTEGAVLTTVVVASRRLVSWADRAVELGPLSTVDREAPGTSPGLSDAAIMLLERAREAGAELETADEPAVSVLATRLEGNPLSLELAAQRLAAIGPTQLLAQLARPLEAIGHMRAEEYPETLAGALTFSWESLGRAERRALLRLALFEGDFTLDDATGLVGEGALDRLQALRERSLCANGSRTDTLMIGSAVRDFVRQRSDRLDPDGRDVHADYVVRLGEWLAHRLERGSDPEALGRLAMRIDDLLVVGERGDLLAARAALAVDPALVGRIFAARHHEILSRAIESCEEARRDASSAAHAEEIRGRLACARGRVGALAGRMQDAFEDLSLALSHAERTEDPEGQAAALMELAVLYHVAADGEVAEQCCHRVLELRSRIDSPRLEARAIGNLGGLAHDAGRLDEAYARYVEAISLAELARDGRLLGVFLGNLAMLDADRGHPAVARSRLHRAIGSLSQAGEERLVAITVANLGMVEIELGHAKIAEGHLRRAARTLEDVGDDRSLALAHARLAAATSLLGDAPAGARSIARARELSASDERTRSVVGVFEAFVWLAEKDLTAAQASRDRAFLPTVTGRDLAAMSDDTRAALRVLARHLPRG